MWSRKLQDSYSRICKIGAGNYGNVYLYECKEDHKNPNSLDIFSKNRKLQSIYVAIKLYNKPSNNKQGIDFSCLREISCMQSLKHPNIVGCYQIIYEHRQAESQAHQIFVVMDYHLEISDLMKIYSSFEDKKRIAKQITKGLKYLHDNYIFHRDMKPENIFVSKSGLVRIADFGFAKQFGTPYKKFTINACTIEYRAPEIFLGTHYYTESADVWSLGCIFAYIFTGKPLFRSENKSQIQLLSEIFYLVGTPDETNWSNSMKMPIKFKCQYQKQKNFAQQLKISNEAAQLIEACMKIDPKKRLTATQVLNHPFFYDVSDEPFEVKDIYDAKIKSVLNKYP